MNKELLHIRIVSPSGILFEGEVMHAVFPGEIGSFAIYPNHAPIISALKKGSIIYTDTVGNNRSVDIDSGFVEVNDNKITVSVEI